MGIIDQTPLGPEQQEDGVFHRTGVNALTKIDGVGIIIPV